MKSKITKDYLLCSSPASTAICSSTHQQTMVRNGLKPLHGLDPNLNHHYKTLTTNIHSFSSSSSRIPCASQLPFTPRPHHRLRTEKLGSTPRRKSSADILDKDIINRYKCDTGYGLPTPVGHSSRYLLGDSERCSGFVTGKVGDRSLEKERHWSLIDRGIDDGEKVMSLGVVKKVINVNNGDYKKVIKSGNHGIKCGDYGQRQKIMKQCQDDIGGDPTRDHGTKDQVVVLKVSLHCKCRGCESKLRKYLSKLQGVTSFSIDLEAKKVTVVGNVSPLEVLTSISKVKNAQFWSSPSSSSSSSSTTSTLDFS